MAFIRAKQIKLGAEGDLLVGGVGGNGVSLAKGAAGEVLRATATGVEYHALSAADITRGAGTVESAIAALETATTFTPIDNGIRSITGPSLSQAIAQSVNLGAITKRDATVDPTVTDDSAAGYAVGDFWLNGNKLFVASDVTVGAAVWTRVDAGAATDVFKFSGTVDASLEANLPADPETGNVYRVTVAGDFEGEGPYVNVGDYIVWNGSAWDVIDNTDPVVSGTAGRIAVTGNADLGYTINIDPTYVGQNTITTLGTITTGTWEGTTIDIAHGGTGLATVGAAGQVLTVNAAGDALEYAYVGALKDSAGANAVTITGTGATAKAVAANATVAGDAANTLATKGFVEGLIASGGTAMFDEDHEVPADPDANFEFTIAKEAIGTVAVYFNGVKLKTTGYTVAGTTVTLVDSVNGYAAEEGDTLSVSYMALSA